jgi:hypothetical protein
LGDALRHGSSQSSPWMTGINFQIEKQSGISVRVTVMNWQRWLNPGVSP